MSTPTRSLSILGRRTLKAACLGAALLLGACGGGGDDNGGSSAQACSVTGQQTWLRDYMRDTYFWYAISPDPEPTGYPTLDAYFDARLYTGSNASFPADRWSFTESTEDFNRFYGDGQTLGYGVSVAGTEVTGRPDLPLYVRYVEAASPAAVAGVQRGDQILSLNGRAAADVIAANDFSALTPAAAGNVLTIVLRNAGVDRSVSLTAQVFALTPVSKTTIVTSPLGRQLGYVLVKDMIDPANAPLDTAFAQFKAAGVQELVIDLRYNGGGLVSVANTLGSYAIGARAAEQTFATLLYNDKHQASNAPYRYTALAQSLGVGRVYVLAGARTCSASELVVNGLRPFVDVVLIGGTTCGKPVGFVPQGHCDITYDIVNFESVNASNEGRYFDGFDATCPVAENFAQPLGAPDEALLAEARAYADAGACSPAAAAAGQRAKALRAAGVKAPKPLLQTEPGERRGMVVR